MNLIYMSYQEYKDKVEKLYLSAFPKEERFPFWLLEECSKENNSDLYAILDGDKFVGMSYIVNCDDAYYLMYLAVEPNLRNLKYGSKILMDLKEKYGTLFLSVEEPVDEISVRRKEFYLRNGFCDTCQFYEDTGVHYLVLCTNDKYRVTDGNMQKRYINMSNDSKLLEIIAATFNAGPVNLQYQDKV